MRLLSVYLGFPDQERGRFTIANDSHDASISLFEDGELVTCYPAAQYFNDRKSHTTPLILGASVLLTSFFRKYGNCYDVMIGWGNKMVTLFLPSKAQVGTYIHTEEHHRAHAYSVCGTVIKDPEFQNNSLVWAIDGGGADYKHCVFYEIRDGELIEIQSVAPFNLGESYRNLVFSRGQTFLIGPGKRMAYSALGHPKESFFQWIENHKNTTSYTDKYERFVPPIIEYSPGSSLTFHDQEVKDFYASHFHWWKEQYWKILSPYLGKYKHLFMSGGTALSGVMNYQLQKSGAFDHIHFIPWPDDSGLTIGQGLMWLNENGYGHTIKPIQTPYFGEPLLDLDKEEVCARKEKYQKTPYTPEKLVSLIDKNVIIGVAKGRSEIGPRALGHRSILANVTIASNRALLNERKNRFWFQPFGPIIRLKDVHKFFELDVPSPYMQFVTPVKSEWLSRIPAICHDDGTSRPQTIEEDHWLYPVLDLMEKQGHIPMLLNTSLNEGGSPTCNQLFLCLQMLEKGIIDCLIQEDVIYSKEALF